jgi:hypothetical protein
MGAATVQAQLGTGGAISLANAEGGIKWNRADSGSDTTTPIPVPTATGTNYSWIKNLVLAVTVAGTTTMSNRRIQMATSPATGLTYDFKSVAVASYAQAASGNQPAASGSNGATPATYTAMTTSALVYDASSVATSGTGANGTLCVCVIGLDFTYAGGPGTNNASPSLTFTYDEQ